MLPNFVDKLHFAILEGADELIKTGLSLLDDALLVFLQAEAHMPDVQQNILGAVEFQETCIDARVPSLAEVFIEFLRFLAPSSMRQTSWPRWASNMRQEGQIMLD